MWLCKAQSTIWNRSMTWLHLIDKYPQNVMPKLHLEVIYDVGVIAEQLVRDQD